MIRNLLKKFQWIQFIGFTIGLAVIAILVMFRDPTVFLDIDRLSENWFGILTYALVLLIHGGIVSECHLSWCNSEKKRSRYWIPFFLLSSITIVTLLNSILLQFVTMDHSFIFVDKYYWMSDYPYLFVPLLLYAIAVIRYPRVRLNSRAVKLLATTQKEGALPTQTLLQLWEDLRNPRVLMQYLHAEHGAEDTSRSSAVRWMDIVLLVYEDKNYFVYLRNGEKLLTTIRGAQFQRSVVGTWFVQIQRSTYANMLYIDPETYKDEFLRLHSPGKDALSVDDLRKIEEALFVTRRGRDHVMHFKNNLEHSTVVGWEQHVDLLHEKVK